jgi:hypothetical protein
MDMKTLMTQNKLRYALPSNLNLVERRQNKVSFADQNSYSSQSGNEVVIRMTASTDYVYGPNSYLTFDVECAGPDAGTDPVGFAKNTALSLFDRVLYEDRSGAELERNDALNSYCAQTLPWTWSEQYKAVGPAMAGQFEQTPAAAAAQYDCLAGKTTVCIPLRWFLGIYDNETLVPSMLVSGSLLRLQLSSANKAFERLSGATTTTITSYTISNPRVVLDSMSLAPVVQKNLMEQSQASGGLDYTYETAYYQSGNPATQTNFNLQINKAVSRCQSLCWSSHAQSTEVKVTKNNLGTCQNNVLSLDYRIGDLYLPQRVITVTDDNPQKNGAELYENSLQSVHRMKTNRDPPSVTKNEYCVAGTALNATPAANNNDGRAVHVQSFEQSSCLQFSGLAINNSRTLEARINFKAIPTPQVIDAWIKYVKLAKCNQIRAIIKE